MVTHVPSETSGDECGMLLSFVEAQRGALRRGVLGLDDEQASATPSASALSLAGLVKHAALCEVNWLRLAQGRPNEYLTGSDSWEVGFRLVGDETVADVLALWDTIAAETEEYFRAAPDLGRTYPLPPAPWYPKDARVSLRWTLAHLVEEFARHAGHADIIRETLDGKNAFELIDLERQAPHARA
ncbi:DinB family protein [Streptomyces sp. NPDC050560]|uniref:DinB family protein n=1 Tax=Streptomyces sp. NPDC050560 TaxID=3365630 RepID=UPI0037A9573D